MDRPDQANYSSVRSLRYSIDAFRPFGIVTAEIGRNWKDTRGRCGDLVAYVSECGRQRELLPAEPPRNRSSSIGLLDTVSCRAHQRRWRRCAKRLQHGAFTQRAIDSTWSQASIGAFETAYRSKMQSAATAGPSSECLSYSNRASSSQGPCNWRVVNILHVSRGNKDMFLISSVMCPYL